MKQFPLIFDPESPKSYAGEIQLNPIIHHFSARIRRLGTTKGIFRLGMWVPYPTCATYPW